MVSPTLWFNVNKIFNRRGCHWRPAVLAFSTSHGRLRIARPNNACYTDSGTFVNIPYNVLIKRYLFIKQRDVMGAVPYNILSC